MGDGELASVAECQGGVGVAGDRVSAVADPDGGREPRPAGEPEG